MKILLDSKVWKVYRGFESLTSIMYFIRILINFVETDREYKMLTEAWKVRVILNARLVMTFRSFKVRITLEVRLGVDSV